MKNLFLLFVIVISCNAKAKNNNSTTVEIKKIFSTHYDQLLIELDLLKSIVQTENFQVEKVKSQFFKTRIAYKNTEALFEYFDRQFVKDHINGAPLPSLERKATSIESIIEPTGFQTLEEAIVENDREAIVHLVDRLHHHGHEFKQYIQPINLTDRMVFEAMREELVRITALGITGFDTPSSENTINENKTAWKSISELLEVYYPYIPSDTQNEYNTIFKNGNQHFENANFDNFDRFAFIANCLDPVYGKLLETQKQLYIETKDLVYDNEFSVNYLSKSIFDTDFLNYKYYSSYSNSGNEKQRQELGKILFFDPILSQNNERACASCHDPKMAFTDGAKKSMAFDGEGTVDRNAPTLINSVFNTRFFWDARASTPEEQAEHVIFSPKEFNTNYQEIADKIMSSEEYIQLFNEAYPNIKKVNKYTIVASLAAYVQSLKSFDSAFDKMMRLEKVENQAEIVAGFNLFSGKAACATCHFIPTFAGNVPPLYVDTETEVVGIPTSNIKSKAELDNDMGRYNNGRPRERAYFNKFSFKTPTLRNIAVTGPYMHNGVFETLEEVVDFYDVGGGHGWGIAPENTTLPSDSLNLSKEEKTALIVFMQSLTDFESFLEIPESLPKSSNAELNKRPIGGAY
ncbi:hypothetical protein K6119_08260 [Paracrocinitomix mangrovi]|uniref:cytochrome-c peroxidase n=1 Tax=Paracrocinitomix mangrovi TaxID=2862509 RepID=UPI001C8E8BC4|nr:cytochrome c peroxidase [Paracrocinitomix mangrovi]UKN03506.1 hypothetical protein K6119_08260 [Paracrocinitomix mangrovi]